MEYSNEKLKTQAKNSKTQAKNSRIRQIHLVYLPKTRPKKKGCINDILKLYQMYSFLKADSLL